MTRLLGIGILAFAAISCSTNPPTAPSALDREAAAVVGSSITTASSGNNEQKVIVHFQSDEYMGGGNIHIQSLPVKITGLPSGTVLNGLTTGKQGQVTIWLPSADTTMQVETTQWNGFCSVTVQVPLPLHGNVDSWILIHRDCF
jgi:hypothetical protein